MTDATAATTTTASGAGDQSGSQGQQPPAATTTGTTALTGQQPATTTEGTTASGDTTNADGQDGKTAGAPEAYAEFTLPEGISLDKAALEGFTPLAKELGLSQENAQKVVDLYATKLLPQIQQAFAEQQTQKVEGWLQDSMKDPEIGGARFDETVSIAKKALDAFGSPALKAALDDSGLGNHPEVIRLLANIGKRVSEDRTASTTSAATGSRSAAEILYGGNN
jgi:hypothetical protein